MHYTALTDDQAIHFRDLDPPQIHPRPCEWLWTSCCGYVVADDQVTTDPEQGPRLLDEEVSL